MTAENLSDPAAVLAPTQEEGGVGLGRSAVERLWMTVENCRTRQLH
jgi:hypothetical protein